MSVFAPELMAAWSRGAWTAEPRAPVTGFCADSRALRAGDAFVALRTERRDGHDFLGDARAKGAACALVSRAVADPLPQLVVADTLAGLRDLAAGWRRAFPGRVVGITGSVGKTSTKELLAALLGAEAFATEANLNNLIGVPLMLLRADPARHRFAVIEAGMSVPGELGLSARAIAPDLSVVTSVAPVHLEGVGSLEGVAREKVELVSALSPGGRAVLPAKLLEWPVFAALASRTIAVRFAGEPAPVAAPARLVEAALGEDDSGRRTLTVDGRVFALAPLSDGLARNAALAVVAARELGLSDERIAAVLAAWTPPSGRGSVHAEQGSTFYLDCYNASPASLVDAAVCFDRLSRRDPAPRLFVLGGMAELGAESVALHRSAAAALPLRAGDRVVAFGGDAPAYLGGITAPGVVAEAVSSVTEVADRIRGHRGFVFVKGSRSHALERCLPESLRATLSFH